MDRKIFVPLTFGKKHGQYTEPNYNVDYHQVMATVTRISGYDSACQASTYDGRDTTSGPPCELEHFADSSCLKAESFCFGPYLTTVIFSNTQSFSKGKFF